MMNIDPVFNQDPSNDCTESEFLEDAHHFFAPISPSCGSYVGSEINAQELDRTFW